MLNINNRTADFLVLGCGIVGLSVARELKKQFPDAKVSIIEKEPIIGEHASGRNSGVLHAGFYYTKDSLKAKFTKQGNEALTEYCLEKNIPINRCGKLVVTRNALELNGLHELYERGCQNNIAVQLISEKDAKEIEPRVKTFAKALFSPTTSSVNPKAVLQHMLADAQAEGIQVYFDIQYLSKDQTEIKTNQGKISAGFIVNAAGLYADKIAKDFNFSKDYRILPFKGLYLYAASTEKFHTHIYPVPDLRNPFLGVHFTLTDQGAVKIGPTAIPAFWREHYHGYNQFKLNELIEILWREATLMFKAGFDFKRLAWEEIKKYNRKNLVARASGLAEDIHENNYKTWGKPGIRAQLLNIKTRKLEMDFIIEGDNKSLHVLNAVSPAFTCSIPFAQHVVNQIKNLVK